MRITRDINTILRHQRPCPRRAEPPALMGFWLAIAAIVLGCFIGYCIGEHRGFVKARSIEPRVHLSTP